MNIVERLDRAWQALRGEEAPAEEEEETGEKISRIQGLELELRDRDEKIESLRQEFSLQRQQAQEATARAGAGEIESLARKLAPLLSQLSTFQTMADEGREVRVGDLLKLFGKVRRALVDAGLEPIGTVGQVCGFESKIHQRMSGGDVRDGDQVKVRFEGYKYGETVITKAMVSREE